MQGLHEVTIRLRGKRGTNRSLAVLVLVGLLLQVPGMSSAANLTGIHSDGIAEVVSVANIQAARITRSSVDRPGPNVWDVKVVYATFKGGPDSKRDTNGQLATLTSNIGSYFARQRPGYQLRFDTFKSQLDIQHIALPVTALEFAGLFTDDGRALEDFMHRVFADAGLPFSWGIHRNSTYGVEKRIYLMYMEGPRGIKYGNNSAIDYQCGRVSEFQSGGRIVGINLRDGAGRVCPGMAAFESNKSRWWEASWDAVRFLAGSLTELPGCDSVTRDEIARSAPQRVENNISARDVLSNKWMIPRNRAEEPVLDLNRNLYFNIKSGPHVGDRCRDIQYSPFWQELPTTKPKAGNPKGRVVVDLPDETDQPKLKVYYVVPNDGVDQRLDLTLTPMMVTADAWLKNQTGQNFRWDTYRGKLDVMFVRLLETEAQLWLSDEPGLDCWDIPCPSPGKLYGILASRGLVGANEIAVILYDGKQSPVQPRPSGCYAGPRFIVGYSMCLGGSVETKLVESAQGSLGIRIMHEVFHTLGAVGEGAPNGDGGFGHIKGDSNDIMAIGTRTGWSVDPGRDDYWSHGRTDLTDISRSVFLVPTKTGAEFPNRWNQ